MRMYVKTYPAHCVHCSYTNLVLEVVSLDETDTVLSGNSALHLHGAFHHAVHDSLGYAPLSLAEENDRCRLLIHVEQLWSVNQGNNLQWKLPSPT